MSLTTSWKIMAAAGLGAATLLLSASALLALGAQTGPLAATSIVGFSEAHDQRAFKILDKRTTPGALAVAAAETSAALRLAPYNNAARLRLVYTERLRERHLTGPNLERFARSYDLIPYDHKIAAWRIAYGLEHWDELTPDVRTAVHAEALAFGRSRSVDVNVRKALTSIHNPEGKLAASLWVRELAR